jgi:hypothetical protein
LICIIVAEVIVMALRNHEQVREPSGANFYDVSRAKSLAIAGLEDHRTKDGSSLHNFIIPIARSINRTARRPHITSWNPNPVLLTGCPKASLPNVVSLEINPIARAPEIVLSWRWRTRAVFNWGGWKGKVG